MPINVVGADENHEPLWPKVRSWCELIVRVAKEKGLDPLFITAVIWQESGGDPLAYSENGAVGLMQVMPRDGLAANDMCQYGKCFAGRPTIEEFQDPEFNIRYGCQMLTDFYNEEGSLEGALRRYNPSGGEAYVKTVMGLYQNIQDSL